MWLVRCICREACACVHQLLANRRELETPRLLGVDTQVAAIKFRKRGEVTFNRGPQCFVASLGCNPLGDRKILEHTIEVNQQRTNCVITLHCKDTQRDVRCDERVAVAVTADP